MGGLARPRALYGNTKSSVSCVDAGLTNRTKLPNAGRFFPLFPRSAVSFGGTETWRRYTPPARGFLRLLNFCFRHQSFMRHRTIRGERRKKLAGNYPRVPVENQHRRDQGERGRRDEPARGSGGRLEKERRGRRCRPKSERRENLARRSVGGRKEVPVRGPPLAFLCIFDTSLRYLVSTLPFPPAHFLYLQASRDSSNAGIECHRSIVSPFAIDAALAGKPPTAQPDRSTNFR